MYNTRIRVAFFFPKAYLYACTEENVILTLGAVLLLSWQQGLKEMHLIFSMSAEAFLYAYSGSTSWILCPQYGMFLSYRQDEVDVYARLASNKTLFPNLKEGSRRSQNTMGSDLHTSALLFMYRTNRSFGNCQGCRVRPVLDDCHG